MRLAFIIFCLAAAGAAAAYGWPYVHNNSDFVTIVVTVFAVFARFLIGVITIIGDPSMIPDGSWRIAESRRDSIEQRLLAHGYIFGLYLVTIGLLLVGILTQHALVDGNPVRKWIERFYLFFAVFSFLLSFSLPSSLIKLQKDRIEAEIERRRRRDGVSQEDASPK